MSTWKTQADRNKTKRQTDQRVEETKDRAAWTTDQADDERRQEKVRAMQELMSGSRGRCEQCGGDCDMSQELCNDCNW